MGAMRKAGVWLGLVEDDSDPAYERSERERVYNAPSDRYEEDDYDADYAEDDLEYSGAEYEAEPPRRQRVERPSRLDHAAAVRSRGATVSPISQANSARGVAPDLDGEPQTQDNLALAPQVALRERAGVNESATTEEASYRITTLHPTTYNEARTIGEHFRNSIPVIMNLTEMDESDAKRLVDFAAGLAFGLRGSIERVTNRVFLLSPASVTVTAEDRARIAEGGFFNQS
ncbi:MAG: cell division protein SepF [Corynebacteriales bacterium]|nr:cell division protein SepF [Mycobacteriales bacterium]